jgi:hypothetical protein
MDWNYWIGYGLGAALVLIAVARPRNMLRARKIDGNVVVGDIQGSVTQNYNANAADVNHAIGGAKAKEPRGDRIAWAIAILGVIVAAAQLAYDVYGKGH